MADTSTERSKRLRRHRKGDHSLCIPGRCPALDLEGEPGPAEAASHPPGLGKRGQTLWDAMTETWRPTPLHRELLLEACRMADRLEQFDRQLNGHDWLRFRHKPDDEYSVVVYVDRVLIEARELQSAFRMVVTDLMKVATAQKPEKKGGGRLASVTALIPDFPSAG